jgi:hypothetical protein
MGVIRMPISNEEWNAGRSRDTLESQVLSLLKQNQNALTLIEAMSGLGYNTNIKDFGGLILGFGSMMVIQNALDKLIKEVTVTARAIKTPYGQQIYYKAV